MAPPPPPPLSRQQIVSLSQSSCVSPVELTVAEFIDSVLELMPASGVKGGYESYPPLTPL